MAKNKKQKKPNLPGAENHENYENYENPKNNRFPSDVLGSYTGVVKDGEIPEQDADDL